MSCVPGSGAWILGGDKQPALVTITEDGSEGPAAVLLSSNSANSLHPIIEVQRTSHWTQFSMFAPCWSIFPFDLQKEVIPCRSKTIFCSGQCSEHFANWVVLRWQAWP